MERENVDTNYMIRILIWLLKNVPSLNRCYPIVITSLFSWFGVIIWSNHCQETDDNVYYYYSHYEIEEDRNVISKRYFYIIHSRYFHQNIAENCRNSIRPFGRNATVDFDKVGWHVTIVGCFCCCTVFFIGHVGTYDINHVKYFLILIFPSGDPRSFNTRKVDFSVVWFRLHNIGLTKLVSAPFLTGEWFVHPVVCGLRRWRINAFFV